MTTIADYVREGGWKINQSSSKTIQVGDVILVTAKATSIADVGIVRNGARVNGGEGRLNVDGDLVVGLGALFLFLTLIKDMLVFSFDDNDGPSPDGGGSGGGPTGNG